MPLTLRRTWPEEPFPRRDWLIIDGGEQLGRMYEITGGGRWFWAINDAAWRAASSGVSASGLAPTGGGGPPLAVVSKKTCRGGSPIRLKLSQHLVVRFARAATFGP